MDSDCFLTAHWATTHHDLGIPPDPTVFAELLAAWSGEGRYYHAVPHLRHGLVALERYGPDAALVRLAWFFHDAIYVTGRQDNELESAQWFSSYAEAQGLAPKMITRGHDLILMTKDHQGAASDDPLWPIMNDVDLGVFAASRGAYNTYAENVWREFQKVATRQQFVLGRAAFMSAFRARPIFLTEEMKAKEPVAHANINAEVERLMEEARREGWV